MERKALRIEIPNFPSHNLSHSTPPQKKKASKASDLARLQELTRKYAEYEAVVVEDRIEKEKARRKAEQEAREMSATVRIQSWWRGVMVRKGLGSYSKKKKKGKGKKGKKSAKRR